MAQRHHPTHGEIRTGTCKWFNKTKGWGFIIPDDGLPEVFAHQSTIHMSGFRNLSDGEAVEFACRQGERGLETTIVTGPGGAPCKGSQKTDSSKTRLRKKNKCFNCGELGHFARDCTREEQPKTCHSCGSAEHLVAQCPTRPEKKEKRSSDGGSSGQVAEGPVLQQEPQQQEQ